MRVLFDISPLGCGHTVPLYRNGTFRYVQRLSCELVKSDEVDLELSAGLAGKTFWEQFSNLDDCLNYLDSDKNLEAVTIVHNRRARGLAHFIRKTGSRSLASLASSIYKLNPLNSLLNPLSQESLAHADIFHSPSFALPEISASVRGLKRFLTMHDLLPVMHAQYFDRGAESRFKEILNSLGGTDWVVCNSESTRNDLIEVLPAFDHSRIFVTHLAADASLFHRCEDEDKLAATRERYKIPDAPYVLSVCAIEPRKNLDRVVSCFTALVKQQKIDDLNLVLAGPAGWKNQDVFDRIVSSGEVRNRIIMTGYVENEDLAPLYSGAMMFVFPSLYEGFGLPPLEAMQCGVPVITSNISALPEVVGESGILVDPRDQDQLCAKMLELYKSEPLRKTLSDSSLERARQFSWQRCLSQTLDAYKAALAS